jgi:hypothetical protein
MKFKNVFAPVLLIIVGISILLVSCSKEEIIEPKEKILVKVADRTISLDEFIRRAEYTIRPPYARGSNNLDKKVVLNSLIAEKLMAVEAGDTNRYVNSNRIQSYLKGRKEQSMRQWLYETEARNKVVIDTAKAIKMLSVAGRKYKISYFNIPDETFARELSDEITFSEKSFEEVYFDKTQLDTIPQREVEWNTHEHDMVLDSLFSGPLKKNQIVGPIRVNDNQFLMVKINGWIDRPAITQQQTQERWMNISDEFTTRESIVLYDQFVLDVMKGKEIEFHPETFFKVTNLLGPVYFKTDEQKKELMEKTYWEKDEDIEDYKNIQTEMELLYQEPLFKVDGKSWTVKEFTEELAVHPLVFREKRFGKNQFGKQLQMAIMDIVRDSYLNDVCYDRGYDKINVIQRNVNMFKDNLSYQYYKNQFLHSVYPDSLLDVEYMPLIEDHLNPLVDSLQAKYSDQIEVDVDAFNDVQLTRIDMSVTQQNVPWVKPVPSFPIVTSDNQLDYGKKMENGPQK